MEARRGGDESLPSQKEEGQAMDPDDVVAGLTAALTVGAVTADVVAVEARMAAARRGHPACHPAVPLVPVGQRVISLTQRRLTDPAAVIAGLPADTPGVFRPWPRMTSS